ncbi:MAG TPA: aspartate kinase [Cyclobacteriaceae bacterium]
MKVFKFGGASVKNGASLRNVGRIIDTFKKEELVVVVSAMGKTTNALEKVISLSESGKHYETELDQIIESHNQIAQSILESPSSILNAISAYRNQIISQLQKGYQDDKLYDQVVSVGELLSSLIVHAHLQDLGIHSEWVDARESIITDSTFREGKVNWAESEKRIQDLLPLLRDKILITQGFIGSDSDRNTTTLGREGSDYSAAIFGSCLNAESVTIWKDVPGVMSADPKRLSTATTFEELPFREAAEMTYYGATVIHPKTIKPLANKGIHLFVKNFDNIDLPGTRIHECVVKNLSPLIVFKDNQCLISCHVTDYTFIDESQIEFIFNSLKSHNLRLNMMQNSAISFSFCLDFQESKVLELIKVLSTHFEVYYNTELTLITIKNYDVESFAKYRNLSGVILEQSSRSTLQVLIKSN